MGLLFTLVGAIMSIYGFFTRGSAIYERSDGMNINLSWGLIMLVFGVIMYTLGRRSDKRPRGAQVEGTTRPIAHGHGGH
jgi:multisubunit Na+/H+ antiporter MnhG subunit